MWIVNREKLCKVYDERKCLCGRLFYVAKKVRRSRSRPAGVRSRMSMTCGKKECQREHKKIKHREIYEANREQRIKYQQKKRDEERNE